MATTIRVPDWRMRTTEGWRRVNTVSIPGFTPEPLPVGSGPFASTSPWNTATPTDTVWYEYPALGTLTTPELSARSGSTSRIWYPAASSVTVWHGQANDPLWTFEMPDYIDPSLNRNRTATTFQMHGPANMVANTDSDKILTLIDHSTNQYAEVWLTNVNTTTRVITCTPGQPAWARGNVVTGPGAGTTGGANDGVRAANFSWIAGLITGDDIAAGAINHALVLALNYYTLDGTTPNSWRAPATAMDNGGAIGGIKMGSKIGVPHGAARPSGLSTVGIMLWNCLQTYGAYVGDYAGGPWPVFYLDAGTVSESSVLPLFAFWEYGGTCDIDRINPYLRVAGYQP